MVKALLIAGAVGLAFSQPGYGQEKYLHTDSIGSSLVETHHVFHCEGSRVAMRLIENRRPGDQLDLVDRWRMTLAEIEASGRSIPAPDLRRLEERIHQFAWIERITARCTRFNREIYVTVAGMKAQEWASMGQKPRAERPKPNSLYFTIRDDGSIKITSD